LATWTLSGCDRTPTPEDAEINRADLKKVTRMIPVSGRAARQSWASDIVTIMDQLKIERNLENTCSIIAIVDQESNFKANPAVPHLGQTAAKEMRERLNDKLGSLIAGRFEQMLQERPSPEDNFAQRLEAIKTEKDLDELYREMFEYFKSNYKLGLVTGAASLFAGHDMAEYFNPVKTLGSMQVHISYALDHPLELSNSNAIRDQMYTQHGGLYYGIHRLMMYQTQYDKPLYRFADFNSGMYSSRNASLQKAIAKLTDLPIGSDGDLLAYNKDKEALGQVTSTEAALRRLVSSTNVAIKTNAAMTSNAAIHAGAALSDRQLRKDLLKEKQQDLEDTETYQLVHALYELKYHKPLAYAIMPEVVISGPKLSHDYDTHWYATRVNGRYLRCRSVGRRLGLK
jgi:hypothetical protein